MFDMSCSLLSFPTSFLRRYLNISGSVVSDLGLLYLAGVRTNHKRTRPVMSRNCKQATAERDICVRGDMPKWESTPERPGCKKLVHFEGMWNRPRLSIVSNFLFEPIFFQASVYFGWNGRTVRSMWTTSTSQPTAALWQCSCICQSSKYSKQR